VDAEGPGLIRGSAHDSPVARSTAAHHHRLAAQLGSIALLDGCEKGVQVDVEDRRAGHASIIAR
jgi:hypothetical protein